MSKTQVTPLRNNGASHGAVKYGGITVSIETITPEVATIMLLGNLVNRRLRPQRVALYAKQMILGQWRLTGESIVFTSSGQLLQGQHRLTACIEAGVPFTTVVVRGVERDAMRNMDTGMARTATDVFFFEGIANSTWQSAAVRQLIGIKRGAQTSSSALALITRDELIDFYRQNSETLDIAGRISGPAYSALRHTRAGWASLAFLACEVDSELAESFFAGIGTGADMATGDARLALRAYCLNRTAQRRPIQWPELVANGIRAWNSWIDGKSIDHIKGWKPAQAWPEIRS